MGIFSGLYGASPGVPRRSFACTLRHELDFNHAARYYRVVIRSFKGSRKGQHSIRINDQWRVCFRWREGAAEEVEIVDYH